MARRSYVVLDITSTRSGAASIVIPSTSSYFKSWDIEVLQPSRMAARRRRCDDIASPTVSVRSSLGRAVMLSHIAPVAGSHGRSAAEYFSNLHVRVSYAIKESTITLTYVGLDRPSHVRRKHRKEQ